MSSVKNYLNPENKSGCVSIRS